MSINWFPGHMVAAADKAREAMADHDVVIEVLDARCPGASGNPTIDKMRMLRQRPMLKVLNKIDIADPAATTAWLAHFNAQKNTRAIGISSKKPGDAVKVLAAAKKLAPHRNDNFKPLRMLIMGVPNVGKSTLINALLKKRVAKTGDEPAITKILHRYDLSSTMQLTDTPGLMWPRIEHEGDGLMLAASHVIGANAYIESEVAVFLAALLLERYPEAVKARYGYTQAEGGDGVDLVEAIAAKRGYLIKGKGPDFDKASMALLSDYRSGALGRLTLELPQSRAGMIAAKAAPADSLPAVE